MAHRTRGSSPDRAVSHKAGQVDSDAPIAKRTRAGSKNTSSQSSSLLEKGIIYFFVRGRVTDKVGEGDEAHEDEAAKPHDIKDIQRSYMILRPIGKDAKLGDGTIVDAGTSRLLALPKKVLPRASGRDRFMAFVEKEHASFQQLRDEFLAGEDHETKTRGVRHTPAATPLAEGVYALTTTGRESHLAYIITLPSELGEIQLMMGLSDKGSFIISTKNPNFPGPQNTRFMESPDFTKEVIDEFREHRWMPTQPKHLDYPRAQLLLIGEKYGRDKAKWSPGKDEATEQKQEEPLDELEHLEEEDVQRMEHLGANDSEAIYADLQVSARDYPKLQTTF